MNSKTCLRAAAAALALLAALSLAACGTKPKAAGAVEKAKERNRRAQSEMEGAFSGVSAGNAAGGAAAAAAPAAAAAIKRDKRGKPNWVDHPEAAFQKTRYLSAVGTGSTRRQAEQNALGNLAAIFGQSVETSLEAVESYRKEVARGAIAVATSVRAEQAVRTSAAMDSLIGAEIGDLWEDGRRCYAVAVMEKQASREIYGALYDANERLIQSALSEAARTRGSMEEAASYYGAARLAEVNAAFATTLAVLGEPGFRAGKRAGEYRAAAKKAAQAIPVALTVAGDKNGKLEAAFAAALLQEGFPTRSGASRYTLEVKSAWEPVTLPNENKWTRWTVDARLSDRTAGTVLFPFSISGREGHISQSEADNRAISAAAVKIQDEYAAALSAYLAGVTG